MPGSVNLKGTPFDEAIAHFQRKVRVPVKSYRDLPPQMHAKAFMVAGANNDALLADFQQSLLAAMRDGTTLERFRDDFDRIVAAHGWQYRGKPGWRSSVIFNTNMRTTYMAGHWQRAWEGREAHPYLRYVQVQRPTKRPEHSAWHGVILPVEDPFWSTHYPPNGWGCQCTVQQVSNARLRAEGWHVSENVQTFPGDVPEEWAYNVGKAERLSTGPENAEWEPLITARDFASYKRPESVPLDKARAAQGPAAANREAVRTAVRAMLGGAGRTFTGPDGLTVGITVASLGEHLKPDRAPLVPLIPEIIESPYEIWLMPYRDKLTGRVELRRRYLKALALGKGVYTWFVAEYRKGMLENVTAVGSSRARELQKQRAGVLVYGRK